MIRITHFAPVLLVASLPAVVRAEPAELCVQRPGQTSSPCTLENGETMVELGLLDWTVTRASGMKDTGIDLGNMLLRHGLTDRLELQIGWTPFSESRSRDALGTFTQASGIGDASIGVQHRMLEGKTALAVNAALTLPVGQKAVSAGDWGAVAQLPISFDVGHDFGFDITPQIEAAVDADGKGRHLAFGGAVGFGLPLSGTIDLGLDLSAIRDRDPAGRSTNLLAGGSLAMRLGANWQFDLGGAMGLNRESPDLVIGLGLARRF